MQTGDGMNRSVWRFVVNIGEKKRQEIKAGYERSEALIWRRKTKVGHAPVRVYLKWTQPPLM